MFTLTERSEYISRELHITGIYYSINRLFNSPCFSIQFKCATCASHGRKFWLHTGTATPRLYNFTAGFRTNRWFLGLYSFYSFGRIQSEGINTI